MSVLTAPRSIEPTGPPPPGTPPKPPSRTERARRKLASFDRAAVMTIVACLVSSFALVWVVYYELTAAAGVFGFAICWYGAFLLTTWLVIREQEGRLSATDRVVAIAIASMSCVLLFALMSIVIQIFLKGIESLTPGFFTDTMASTGPLAKATDGGAWHSIVGLVQQVGLATLISVPLGIATAVFLNEIGGRLRRPVRMFVDAMSGVPSIVAGLFIYAVWVLRFGFSGFAAALALSVIMLPTITRTSEEVLRLVPSGLREASLAMGATEWRTTWNVVLPTAGSGLVTAVLLGVARAVGDTAALIATCAGFDALNTNPFEGQQDSLPLFIYKQVRIGLLDAQTQRAWTGALVLLMIVLFLFTAARLLYATEVRPSHPETSDVTMNPDTIELHPADAARSGPVAVIGTGAPMVAEDVSAWFGANKVLDQVSLAMPARSVTALIGPSGCGKSTFIRTLNRTHELVHKAAMSGQVLLDGQDIYAPTIRPMEVRRRIGMVFQKPNPFPAMTIAENVLSGPKLTGMRVESKDDLVEECLNKAGLWKEVRNRLKTPGGALSGGQQQRLCIARSLAVRPEVLLMDEPCSALDPTSSRRIEETIAELVDEVTIVIVTHNMQQAHRVSNQCAFFLADENEPGRIVEAGPTQQIFDSPGDPRTEDYIHGVFG